MMDTSNTGVADTAETVRLEVFSVTDERWYPVDWVDAMTEGSGWITAHFIDTQDQQCRKRVDTQGQHFRKRVLPGSEALHACEQDPELFFGTCCPRPSKPPPKSCAATQCPERPPAREQELPFPDKQVLKVLEIVGEGIMQCTRILPTPKHRLSEDW